MDIREIKRKLFNNENVKMFKVTETKDKIIIFVNDVKREFEKDNDKEIEKFLEEV